ncbi:MAG: sugar ABC transporter permease [Eubacteriales bacterium]
MVLKRRKNFSYAKYGYIFSLPFIITFLIFSLYPTIFTAVLGFTDSKGLANAGFHLLKDQPFQNFASVLQNNSFITSVKNTALIWTVNFIPQMLIALLLTAWFTSKRNDIKFQGFFKVIFYMPNIITAASIAVLFATLFGYPEGPINDLLIKMGVVSAEQPYQFFQHKLASQNIIAFIQFWMWYGYTMLILIAGVKGINPQIFEAAEIDGATGAQAFFRITLPNLKTILLYVLITSLIGGLNIFDIPKLLVPYSGPDNATLTVSVFIYNQAFSGSYFWARAAAASMILFAVIAVCSGIIFYVMRDRDAAELRKETKRLVREQRNKLKAQEGR